MEEAFKGLTEFVQAHRAWAAPIVFALAFAESLAFLSLFVPAWGALVAIGALAGAGSLSPWPLLVGGGLGAALGDWVSYALGYHFRDRIATWWPFSRSPTLLPRAEAFMKKWGVPGVFIGRFSGPLRATVPLVAGIAEMPFWHFQIANVLSAFIWAGVLLAPGFVGVKMVPW